MMVVQLHPVAQKVVELLEPHIERQGYELVAVEFRSGARGSMLRIAVDKPEQGISLSEIERLTPILSDLLDVYDPIDGRYMLEISSPGVNRPLCKVAHFAAARGERIKVRLIAPRDGRKQFGGTLREVSETEIELDDDTTKARVVVGYAEMAGANLEYDFDRDLKGHRDRNAV